MPCSYLDVELKATLSVDPEFRWCVAADCKSGQVHFEGDIFTCITCQQKSCIRCMVPWHAEETCEDYQGRMRIADWETIQAERKKERDEFAAKGQEEAERACAQRREDDEASAQALKVYAKTCPGCDSKVQKTG